MSVECTVVHGALLVRTLQSMCVSRETWVTIVFMPSVVVCHASTDDHTMTATATLPVQVFGSIRVKPAAEPQRGADPAVTTVVSAASLIDALTLGGVPSAFGSGAGKATLKYPTGDGRFSVEVVDGDRTLQATLATRPPPDQLLNLRFSDALIANSCRLRGEVARELIGDMAGFQADHVLVSFANGMLRFMGKRSPLGEVDVSVPRSTDGVLSYSAGNASLEAQFLSSHLALALGVGKPPGGGGRSGRSAGPPGISSMGGTFGMGGGSAFGGGGGYDTGFDIVEVAINEERQMMVKHLPPSHDPQVQVHLVVSPLAPSLDDEI